MSNLGFDAMLKMLGGSRDSVKALTTALGKTIKAVVIDENDILRFEFEDGYNLQIADAGQDCCEWRYMRTDDDLNAFVGATLLGIELVDAPNVAEDHEVQFLHVQTSDGRFTCSSHNEHNGYYGGFAIVCSEEPVVLSVRQS